VTNQESFMLHSINQDIVYALAASPDNCFAARHSGLWQSDDGGSQWHRIGAIAGVPAGTPASAVAVSPFYQSDGTVFAGVPGGILRSTDGGKQWAAVALPSPSPFVSALAVSPNYEADGVVFAATLEDGVFRSHDRGATWQAWNFGLFDRNILSMAVSPGFAHDRTIYVGTETGVFCSKNGGRAWREIGFPTEFAPVLSLAISPQFAQDGILFAGTESAGLLYSADRGQTWQQVLICEAINTILLSSCSPVDADVLVASNDTLWFSRDGGKSWSNRNPEADFGAEFTVVIAPSGFAPRTALLVGLADGRVLRI
jgi:photosystem II stability/assembly factor-like uncharacterized protein